MRFVVGVGILLAAALGPAIAEECPGHPDALGTSRVLTISPEEFSRVGGMQYKQSLPLADHEVVITFDDGPLPPYSNIVLDTLAAHCVKATYFLVGTMARAYPAVARRMFNDGHTIGTHSLDHPLIFQRLGLERVEREVDGGIALVDTAIGDPKAVAPFFRIPGLGRSAVAERFLAEHSLVTWSADVVADDWFHHISAQQIAKRALRRLDAKGRGILLLHDIHPATAMALPSLLKELKSRGYHVVQVVPTGERPASVPALAESADQGGWPRVLKTSVTATVKKKTVLRHHVGKKLAGRHRVAAVGKRKTPRHTAEKYGPNKI
ncbi:MAG TPA: polysaccharide deacetylase family protein [Pseudolabrys sp.]|jgi:peptidoglycan/xylan/chitin deacetylase (PgdA/CDA1 family)